MGKSIIKTTAPLLVICIVVSALLALTEGVTIETLVNPVSFIGENGKLKSIALARQALHEFDNTGRRKARPIEGSIYTEDFDVAIPAVSQSPDTAFLAESGVALYKGSCILADEDTMATSEPGIFAGGDAYRSPEDVVHAIHDAKKAAAAIDQYLGGEGQLYKGPEIAISDYHIDGDVVIHDRFPKSHVPAAKAVQCFCEVNLGMNKLDAEAEAKRCLGCDRR